MILKIKTTKIDLTDDLSEYISKKFQNMDTLLGGNDPDAIVVEIEIGLTTEGQNKGLIHRTELNLSFGGELLRSEKIGESFFEAIDLVKNDITRQIRKFKSLNR